MRLQGSELELKAVKETRFFPSQRVGGKFGESTEEAQCAIDEEVGFKAAEMEAFEVFGTRLLRRQLHPQLGSGLNAKLTFC